MSRVTLSKRLLSASKFVRQGAYFADIGTDHAYLPIFLLQEGRISRAVCADINEGPLESARRNAEGLGYAEKTEFYLTDGAEGLSDKGITDYAVCGMGGELIADIIHRSPHLKNRGLRLILQPMSRQGHLRRYLAENGFSVVGEDYSYDGGKYYLSLAAEYTGAPRPITDVEAELGLFAEAGALSSEARGYFSVKLSALKKSVNGKRLGGEDFSREEELMHAIDRLLNEKGV